jgi:hypothetical protein
MQAAGGIRKLDEAIVNDVAWRGVVEAFIL